MKCENPTSRDSLEPKLNIKYAISIGQGSCLEIGLSNNDAKITETAYL